RRAFDPAIQTDYQISLKVFCNMLVVKELPVGLAESVAEKISQCHRQERDPEIGPEILRIKRVGAMKHIRPGQFLDFWTANRGWSILRAAHADVLLAADFLKMT